VCTCSRLLVRNSSIVTSGVIILTFPSVVFNMLLGHIYSSGARQFPINIPGLVSSDLTIPTWFLSVTARTIAAEGQRYFSIWMEFQRYPVNLQVVFLIASNFVLLQEIHSEDSFIIDREIISHDMHGMSNFLVA